MITFLGAPFILPAIVTIFGLLAIWGHNGFVSKALILLGGDPLNIYGLRGVVLAHVFFNLPLATRLILQGWNAIPAEHFRLAASLDMKPSHMLRHLEWPMLRGVLPGAFLLIFLLASTSFAIALALGGGPKATTIELAIFQSLRFDFNLSKAAILASIQFALTFGLGIAMLLWSREIPFGASLLRNLC